MHRFDVKANRLNAVYLVTKDTYVKANPRIRLNVENKTLSERLHKRVQYSSTKEFALTSDLVRYIYIYKLASKRKYPLLSKAAHKNSPHRNKQFCTQVWCNNPLLITYPTGSDYLYYKEIKWHIQHLGH